MAKQIVNKIKKEPMLSQNSAEYAFDFAEDYSSFGSQLNIKQTCGEYDDIPSFVQGKVLYFVKGVTVEPFGVNPSPQITDV